jgi:hypothetical protein
VVEQQVLLVVEQQVLLVVERKRRKRKTVVGLLN